MNRCPALAWFLAALFPAASGIPSEENLQSPETVLGLNACGEGAVLDSTQAGRYLRRLQQTTKRARLLTFGLSTEGRPLLAALISSERNLLRLGDLREEQTKPSALITCGIHPAEVGTTLAGLRLAYRLLAGLSPRAAEVLESTIVILVPCMNPDGTDRVASWLRSGGGKRDERLPFLQHRFVGHDLNRDWLLGTQAETRAAIEHLHNRFKPWLTLDLHQMAWNGPRLFVPPYAEPYDPEAPRELIEATRVLGDQVLERFTRSGRPGVARRFGYDFWSPSRAYSVYHGGIRFLIEAASGRYQDSMDVAASALRVFGGTNAATDDHPMPWRGGRWGLPEITDYLCAACEYALEISLEDPIRSAREECRLQIGNPSAVRLDGMELEDRATRDLLESLRVAGVRIEQVLDRPTWIVRDPEWGRGWCRSLLLSRSYPAVDAAPYDTSGHDLARLAGLRARSLTGPEVEKLSPSLRSWRGETVAFSRPSHPPESYGKIFLLAPGIPSSDEGWLRWMLEDLHFQFQSLSTNDLETDKLDSIRGVIILVPDSTTGISVTVVQRLQAVVRAGGRVLAIGRSARDVVREVSLGLVEAGTGTQPIHGAILQTRFGVARAEDPVLAGYLAPPAVLFDEGPVWRPVDRSRVETLLSLDRETPLVSGLLGPETLAAVRGGSVLARIRDGTAGGEWILLGFSPTFRGWTSGCVRLLENALTASSR